MGRGDAAIAAIGRDARRELSKVIVDTMTLAVRNLSNSTPVDTEHAASNWIVTFGSPFKGVAGSRVNVSWSEFYNGLAKLKRYDVGRDGRVYIRNNVLYLQYLDRGHGRLREEVVVECVRPEDDLSATRKFFLSRELLAESLTGEPRHPPLLRHTGQRLHERQAGHRVGQ